MTAEDEDSKESHGPLHTFLRDYYFFLLTHDPFFFFLPGSGRGMNPLGEHRTKNNVPT